MIWSVARLTLRECFRRPFPYVLAATLVAAVLASRLFLAFTFGQDRAESLNLAISAAFLGGFAVTTFLGTGLVRRDFERRTLGWLLSMPLGPAEYVAGRLAGLLLASLATAGAIALGSSPILITNAPDVRLLDVLSAAARTVSPILVLGGAAIALSTVVQRIAAPAWMLAIFLLGSFAGGVALPDFALFGLDANATAPGPLTLLYGLVFCSIFALLAYIVLAIRPPARSQD